MSQASASPESLYPPWQIHQLPTVNGCRWAWCRLIFSTPEDLVNHVIHDHVMNSIPVMRKDLPMIRRAEEGNGESFGLSVFGLSNDPPTSKSEQEVLSTHEIPPEIELASSLPFPPVSSPSSVSLHPPPQAPSSSPSVFEMSESGTSESETSEVDQPSPAPSHCALSRHSSLLASQPSPKTPSPMQDRFGNAAPSFAALSSPIGSPLIPPIPPTPSFNSQVESVTGRLKRDKTPLRSPRITSPIRQSFDSHSPLSSQDSVEKHLTQSPDINDSVCNTSGNLVESNTKPTQAPHPTGEPQYIDEPARPWWQDSPKPPKVESTVKPAQAPHPTEEPRYMDEPARPWWQCSPEPPKVESTVKPAQAPHPTEEPRYMDEPARPWWQCSPEPPQLSQIQMEALLQPTTAIRHQPLKQAWYGTRPAATTIKQKSSVSATKFLAPQNVSFVSTPVHTTTPTSNQPRRPQSNMRSGPSETTSAASMPPNNETQEEALRTSHSQSQSQTEESPLEYMSYPLHTQAPYQSQSSSQ